MIAYISNDMSLHSKFLFLVCLMTFCAKSAAILNGVQANNSDFPYAVVILRGGDVIGGGSLVSPIHVITSCRIIGHFQPPDVEEYFKNRTKDFRPFPLDNVTLVAGSRWIYSLKGGQSRSAGDSYPHPSCTDSKFGFWLHDVGAFEATRQFDFGRNLHSLYFWTYSRDRWKKALDGIVATRSTCIMIGWGRTKKQDSSEWLMFSRVRLVPAIDCAFLYCTTFSNHCSLAHEYFDKHGKLCVEHSGHGRPAINDYGNGLYCQGYYYGLLSYIAVNVSKGSMIRWAIFDRMDHSFDFYKTLALEAKEGNLDFPVFTTIIRGAANMIALRPWLVVLPTFFITSRIITMT